MIICIYKNLESFRDTSSQIFNWTLWVLSIEPKIPEIFVYTSKDWSDPNIWDQLRRWSTLIGLVISIGRTEVSLSIGKIVVPNTPLLYPAYKNNNQMRGGLRSGLFNRNVPFHWALGTSENFKPEFLLNGKHTQSQTSKTSESTARLSLAERWMITEFADNHISCGHTTDFYQGKTDFNS